MARGVYIEMDECIGCEACVEVAPNTFTFDEGTGKAQVVNPSGDPEAALEEAIDVCPANCIYWDE